MIKHYVGETGTALIVDTGVLIGSATAQAIIYRKPDGTTTGTFAASLYSSYSALAALTGTYLLTYALKATDLNQPGEWRFQSFVASVNGTWYGELVKMTIYDLYQ